jgi:hypothetical protein
MKPCSECGLLLEATTANFHANASHWDGLEYACRKCRCQREHDRIVTRHKYVSPPMPTGPECLVCGWPTRNHVCLNCGMAFVSKIRRVA